MKSKVCAHSRETMAFHEPVLLSDSQN